MSLGEAIEEAKECFEKPPPNEACTCDWVIYPLLLACGYVRREIVSRVSDNNGQFPDYTLLPDNHEFTWYLEAKSWTVSLEDRHAQQSLNYANQNGKRWVVLTNGQVWRLYDNRIQGIAADKLVWEVRLTETDIVADFFAAIGKSSICSGGLDKYVAKFQIKSILDEQLSRADSEIVRGICSILKKQFGLQNVPNEEVFSYLRKYGLGSTALPRKTLPSQKAKQTPIPLTEPKPSAIQTSVDTARWTLKALSEGGESAVTGKHPQKLILPDGLTVAVSGTWVDVAEAFVSWVAKSKTLPPLPFQMSKGQHYINTTPTHVNPDVKMRSFRKVAVSDNYIFVHAHGSAVEHVRRLMILCKAIGVNASEVVIELK